MDSTNVDHEAFVLAHTQVSTAPIVPEIKLHLGDDAFSLWERTEETVGETDQQPPFWGFAWPGGQALARYLLDHPQAVAGRTVLDLGAGCGLTAVAAALAGARAVLASDLDPFAKAAITLNAQANGVTVSTTGDVLDEPADLAEVVLAADIWYEKQLSARVLDFLRKAAALGATILVSDIGRAYLPPAGLRELATYEVPVIAELENASFKRARILTL